MENHNPVSEKELGIFGPGDGRSALGKVTDWFSQQPPCQMYVGYDHHVYPHWRLEVKYTK